ncbi:ABC transporter ATP-binding protein [Janthinobacterium sp. 17J80-10]|uniref:ABC transporter ATP-binding protein n=1 Tax=Janthinobacterium sp. 17J80-10 TaxID=2497863 RepID=UPI001F511061|nr:ABC transporter ATP-binding protein [Janthinobacterium sp. 17J80-10]
MTCHDSINELELSMSRNVGHLEVRELHIEFPGKKDTVRAVDGVEIEVASGEFISVIGPSGCGKSTLLNAVAGFVQPTSGSVNIDGKPITGPGADRGVVFQQYSLFPWKSVLGNVEFGLKLQGVARQVRQDKARHLLKLAGLAAFERHYPHQLSGGMKQRVGIIRALAANPRILLMDEPFGALDTQTRAIMQQILTDLWQTLGISVLFVTHDIDEAIFLSDRVYVMSARPGKIMDVVTIPLPRPRHPDVVVSAEFLEIRAHLRALIRQESLRAFASEAPPTALAA